MPASATSLSPHSRLSSLTITDRTGKRITYTDNGDGTYAFTYGGSPVTVKAVFAAVQDPGETAGGTPFLDVRAGDWFYDQVVGSIRYGWINGYEDGTFRPNNTITRAEVTTIVNRMLGRAADKDYVDSHKDQLRQFPDVAQTNWAYYNIVEATNAHDYEKSGGTEDWTGLAD